MSMVIKQGEWRNAPLQIESLCRIDFTPIVVGMVRQLRKFHAIEIQVSKSPLVSYNL